MLPESHYYYYILRIYVRERLYSQITTTTYVCSNDRKPEEEDWLAVASFIYDGESELADVMNICDAPFSLISFSNSSATFRPHINELRRESPHLERVSTQERLLLVLYYPAIVPPRFPRPPPTTIGPQELKCTHVKHIAIFSLTMTEREKEDRMERLTLTSHNQHPTQNHPI